MGRAIVAGGKPAMEAPSTGILASNLAVGSTVKLMENGSVVEYLVIHKGLPSSLYDSSCNGVWLVRRYAHLNTPYSTNGDANYGTSTVNTYLNGTFLNSLGSVERSTIKQVKIPYKASNANDLKSGANGLSVRVFLLSGAEFGFDYTPYDGSVDGAPLSYFDSDAKRATTLDGSACNNFTRTRYQSYSNEAILCGWQGAKMAAKVSATNVAIRPALIIPSTALFDAETMLLKGVA